MRSLGPALGVLALAAAAFVLGTQWGTLGAGNAPGERVRAALADPDPISRAMVLVPVLRDLEGRRLDEVEDAYRATFAAGGPGDTAIAFLCEAWAVLDPVGALDRTSSWPPEARLVAQKALLRAWARRNFSAAMEWAAGIHDDGTAAEAVFAGWAESGDSKMWDYVATMEPSFVRESALTAMMQWLIMREGYEQLFARVEALPDDAPNRFKRTAIGTASALVANDDPARALAFVDRHLDSPHGQGLLRRVAVRWVVRDGPAAMQELLDRPASPDRDWALREAYRAWLRHDHPAALAWMPEEAVLDARYTPLVDIYAVAIANSDPEHRSDAIRRAIRWAERTPDAGKRRESFVQLGVIWLYYEPDAASAWLIQNRIEAETRAEAERYRRLMRQFSSSS